MRHLHDSRLLRSSCIIGAGTEAQQILCRLRLWLSVACATRSCLGAWHKATCHTTCSATQLQLTIILVVVAVVRLIVVINDILQQPIVICRVALQLLWREGKVENGYGKVF